MKNLSKYLSEKPDYITPFEDEEFGIIYHEQVKLHSTYLETLTTEILKTLKPDFTEDEFKNFQSWVYMFGSTIRDKQNLIERDISNKFKSQIRAGMRVKVSITNNSDFGGKLNRQLLCRVIENSKGEIFLLPPRCRNSGYNLNSLVITAMEIM